MTWAPYQGRAIAAYPYNSPEPWNLSLFVGDELELKQRQGQWVLAQCASTHRTGICPINRLIIVDDRKKESGPNILLLESVSLIQHLIYNIFIPSTKITQNDYKLFNSFHDILSLLPPVGESCSKFSKLVDYSRTFINAESILRCKNGKIKTLHDVSFHSFHEDHDRTLTELQEISHAITVDVSFRFKINRDTRIIPALYSPETNQQVTSPGDIFLHEESDDFTNIKFHNLDPDLHYNLIIKVLSHQRFGDQKCPTGPWCNEHLGIFCHPIPFKLETFQLDQKVQNSDEPLPPITVRADITHVSGDAACGRGLNSILTLGYPELNMTPSFSVNSLFVKLHTLTQKSNRKRTRVVIKLLDTRRHIFIDAFEKTHVADEFVSAVQKGSTELEIDEIAQINLDDVDVTSSSLIFEVQRPSKSKGTNHLSSWTVYNFKRGDGSINLEPVTLPLYKPTKEKMTAKDYSSVTSFNDSGSGSLKIGIDLTSSKYTGNSFLHRLINWETCDEPLDDSLVANFDLIPVVLRELFMDKIFVSMAKIIASGKASLKPFAVKIFEACIKRLDIDKKTTPGLIVFFNNFLDRSFVPQNSCLASIYQALLQYISSSLTADEVEKRKLCCRIMPYLLQLTSKSLELNKSLARPTDEAAYKQEIKDILRKLNDILLSQETQLLPVKSFVYRSFPMFADIIHACFEPSEASAMVLEFFSTVQKEENKGQTINNKFALFQLMLETKHIHIDREALMPFMLTFIKEMTQEKTSTQSPLVLIESLFFTTMKTTSNFTREVSSFCQFLPFVLSTKSPFSITLLHYLNTDDLVSLDEKTFHAALDFLSKTREPLEDFFLSIQIFIKMVSLFKNPLFKHKKNLLPAALSFYSSVSDFLRKVNQFDRIFFTKIYGMELDSLASVIPLLVESDPENENQYEAIHPLLDVYLKSESEHSRKTVTNAFFLVTSHEFNKTGKFERCENSIITGLSQISESSAPIEQLSFLFDAVFDRFQTNEFVTSFFTSLHQMIIDLHDIAKYTPTAQNEDLLGDAIVSFYEAAGKNETLLPVFLEKLLRLHQNCGNDMEAAETLLVSGTLNKWIDTTECLDPLSLMGKTEAAQLQALKDSARLFIRAEQCDKAANVLEILKNYYRDIKVDYNEYAEILQLEIECYESYKNEDLHFEMQSDGSKEYVYRVDGASQNAVYQINDSTFISQTQLIRTKRKLPNIVRRSEVLSIDPLPANEKIGYMSKMLLSCIKRALHCKLFNLNEQCDIEKLIEEPIDCEIEWCNALADYTKVLAFAVSFNESTGFNEVNKTKLEKLLNMADNSFNVKEPTTEYGALPWKELDMLIENNIE